MVSPGTHMSRAAVPIQWKICRVARISRSSHDINLPWVTVCFLGGPGTSYCILSFNLVVFTPDHIAEPKVKNSVTHLSIARAMLQPCRPPWSGKMLCHSLGPRFCPWGGVASCLAAKEPFNPSVSQPWKVEIMDDKPAWRDLQTRERS